jgi:hypothetical protein
MHPRIAEPPPTLVWIDAEEALIVRWGDRATVERVRAEAHERHGSTGRVRVGPAVRDGGSAEPEATEEPEGTEGTEAPERVLRAHLAAFVHDVAEHLPPDGDVIVVGPGMIRDRLERDLRAGDRRLGRRRHVHAAPGERMTEVQLVARVCELAGDVPRGRGLPE